MKERKEMENGPSLAAQHQLVVEWNETKKDYPKDKCVHELFEEQVERTPDAVAVVFEDQRLNYRELNRRANQLAHYLRAQGVRREDLVGICMERSVEMVVGILGILKAGGAYVPLDPSYPKERLAFMLEDTQIKVLLTQERLLEKLPTHDAALLCLDRDWEELARQCQDNPPHLATPDNLLYVIYTSGSTGTPKGTLISHHNVVRLFHATESWFHFNADDVWTLFHSYAFDFSVWELWGALLHGGRLVIVPFDVSRSPREFYDLLCREQVTVLNQTPSAFRQLMEADRSMTDGSDLALRLVIFGGEALDFQGLKPWFERHGDQKPQLINMYGITETTVHVTYRAIKESDVHWHGSSLIGVPLPDLELHVLDQNRQLVPLGVAGELYVGGAGLARGYLNRPELSAERFVSHTFDHGDGKRLYRTGDLVRRLSSGELEYLGRIDNQVKIRGFRIELGEIEAILRQHPAVRETVALAREDNPGEKRIAAYVIFRDEQACTTSELRSSLKTKLPEYMVPSAFVFLDAWPLTTNGKLDRSALLAMAPAEVRAEATSTPPDTPIEEKVAKIWADVLAVGGIGIHDNFFDIGGHSLLLVAVRSQLKSQFGHEFSMNELFRYSTIASLAALIRQKCGDAKISEATHSQPGEQTGAGTGSDNAIAIIGMAGRFPGAKDLNAFWHNLCHGIESISFFSDEDLLSAGVDAALLRDPKYVKAGAVFPDASLFDASFFGVSPREAELMDPQQRVFLECTWEALEHAGYGADNSGRPVGVFAGVGMNNYILHNLSSKSKYSRPIGAFQLMIANDKDFLPSRVSYKLNLRGPSINVQTACSTSLVAVHLACQSLLRGECEMALAGGVSLRVPQRSGYLYEEGMILSPDGHCRPFDARAQGTVIGSGAGVVVLKRLSNAVANGDCIHAVIKGSAVNNDGSLKIGYTAPSVEGQAAVITMAQASAGVEAETIGYIEAHGTATALGDPIEFAALVQAFRLNTHKRNYCAIGSVKSNIGHLDAAAGVAGLIKTVLALQHKVLPPSLHFEIPNPQIDFADSPFFVNAKLTDWKLNGSRRRAGVSSFGIGGTNCHVILEEAPEKVEPVPPDAERTRHVLVLSAKSEAALRELSRRYAKHLAAQPNASLPDVCFTANVGRTHFAHRLGMVSDTLPSLMRQLEAFAKEDQTQSVASITKKSDQKPKIAFLFTGQGSQYVGMGRELFETQPSFRRNMQRCDAILHSHLPQSLLQVLCYEPGPPSALDDTAYAQPSLFALEYSLAELWKCWGVEPTFVMGHSVGELVAACVAGVMSLEDGLTLAAERGRLMQALQQGGEMVAVLADEARVAAAIQPYTRQISIAALNGPANVVISGMGQAIQAVVATLKAEGIETRPLLVSHAFHSPLMEAMLPAFARVAAGFSFLAPKMGLISNVTGDVAGAEVTKTDYWCSHICQPVRFAAAMKTLRRLGCEVFVEIGPQPILLGMSQDCLPPGTYTWLPSLRRGLSNWQQLLQSLGALFVSGVSVDWSAFDRDYQRRRVVLPTYPFERQRYWVEPEVSDRQPPAAYSLRDAKAPHPLVGRRLRLPMSKEIRFENQLGPYSPAILKDHKIFGLFVLSASTDLAMFLSAIKEAFGVTCCRLEELYFLHPLILTEEKLRTVQLVLIPVENGKVNLQFMSQHEGSEENDSNSWTVHVTGNIKTSLTEEAAEIAKSLDVAEVQARCPQVLSGADFYSKVWGGGLDTGPSFQWLKTIWHGEGEALGQTDLPDQILPDEVGGYQLHPGLIEACFQLLVSGWKSENMGPAESNYTYVPFSIAGLRFYHSPRTHQLWCHARNQEHDRPGNQGLVADFRIFDTTARLIAEISGFEVRRLSREILRRHHQQDSNKWLSRVTWQAKPLAGLPASTAAMKTGSWMIFADPGEVGIKLASLLRERGAYCSLVYPGQSYRRVENGLSFIDPNEPKHFEQLFYEIASLHHPHYRGLIYLWSLGGQPAEYSLSALQEAQTLGCGGALYLVQALLHARLPVSPRLWLVTRGVQPVSHPAFTLHQAPLWGLGHVIALEHPEFQCVRVDLDPSTEADEIQLLFQEICSTDAEDQVAFRGGDRYVARLGPYISSQRAQRSPIKVRDDSTYLISGGLGALALKVSQWLVEEGARHLVLSGRRGVTSSAQQDAVQALENRGVQVLIVKADLSQPDEASGLLKIIEDALPPLRGVIHAAGILDDGILLQQNWGRFCRVMAPKVAGSWNLHRLTQTIQLDFFVCFSSAASVLGARGQGNYAAANAFLDALAHYRRARGLPGLSINWGPWAEVGMAAELKSQYQQKMAEQGWEAIAPAQGLHVLQYLLGQDEPQVAVLPIDWSKYFAQYSANQIPLYFSEWVAAAGKKIRTEPTAIGPTELLRRLEQASKGEACDLLTQFLQQRISKILGLAPEQLSEPNRSFYELGVDSLMIMELRNDILRELGIDVAVHTMFEQPSIVDLTRVISAMLVERADVTGVLSEIESLSEEEVGHQISHESR